MVVDEGTSGVGTEFTVMANTMSAEQKLQLIKQNLQEVLNPEILEDVVIKHQRPLKIYWGT